MEKLVGKRYFDINQDFAVIKDGGFFCQACLIGKDKAAISPDPRYCQDCYDFLRRRWKRMRDGLTAFRCQKY